ncbi:hypothetical protein N7492_009068 [Penicillium capsulatum]|uniref:Uncharacterized protein n=1 Tax=Penicillium capsulatum TaxID=69766 RepID=A0A9W9LHX0_9EURO|nr:hypothetical protein N7492_009068 [Penicillium capsulatum]KAJ6106467.1 hypothetical protein N7512_009984 [Penicillium capsulatum]
MLFQNLFAVTTILATAFSSPTNMDLLKRDDPKPPANSVCALNEIPATNNWAIYAPLDAVGLDGKCGNHYLNNLRGRCGVITTWKCWHVNKDGKKIDSHDEPKNVEGAVMTFYTSVFCSSDDVRAAMGASAKNDDKPDKCSEPAKWMLPPS